MQKISFILILSSLVASCGNSEKQEKQTNDSIPAPDTTAMADTSANDNTVTIPVYNADSWQNPDDDIADGYMVSVHDLVAEAPAAPNTDEMDYVSDYLTAEQLEKLNTRELIFYCLAYPASFSQNCNFDSYMDSTNTPKIVSYFVDAFGESSKSNLQDQALQNKRDSVIIVINQFIAKHPGKTDPLYLVLLKDLNAIESIPVIAKTATSENLGNYTLMVNLMSRANYEPFKATAIYEKMYGENSSAYGSRIEASDENMKLIKDMAMQFYKENKK
jgi:hypothetical protein